MAGQAAIISALFLALGASAMAIARESGETKPSPRETRMGPLLGPLSQAQLIQGLQAHGYTDIKLSSGTADPYNPHPELAQSVSSASDPKAQTTPVHLGWNGTAVKQGRIYDIYLRAEAPQGTAANVPGIRKGGVVNVYLDNVEAGAR